MKTVRSNLMVVWLCSGLCVLGGLRATAQNTTNSSLPPLPPTKSPVDIFREMLAMEPAVLRVALSNRTEAARTNLLRKIRDYQSMDPDERELRLQATELRWYLLPLMRLPATNRVAQLTEMRPELRTNIESRLVRWDALPAELREQFIQNDEAMALLLKIGSASERLQQKLVADVPLEWRDSLRRSLARLDAMSPGERRQAFDVFENVFTMTPGEKQKALGVMSEAEKKQMEKTLAAFDNLPRDERKKCIRAFERFAGMTANERALFYRNVQQWEKMSPKERQKWRDVIRDVEMLPPVFETKPELPPVPQGQPPRITNNKV